VSESKLQLHRCGIVHGGCGGGGKYARRIFRTSRAAEGFFRRISPTPRYKEAGMLPFWRWSMRMASWLRLSGGRIGWRIRMENFPRDDHAMRWAG